ncbi:amidohydrolase [Longimycelium tulufanense]|uniref:Amidohydrolase n=1 Tax=Longimycelium tulufanense TaxID=907463 RepID=A0A8J3CKL7_9PSEU|nr:amidohydrolase family protein [Longimycelium tulufanense]GGM81271.1 amidohydrolase [Longimycelium tulufanense]
MISVVDILIEAGQILLGPAGNHLTDAAVLVRGGSIEAVGLRAEIAQHAAADTQVLRAPEATVLPGLINSHVHLAFDAGPDPVGALQDTDDTDLLLGMASRARQLLDAGITTARDLGDRNELAVRLREAIAQGRLPGPRLLTATTPLTPPGGHCWFLGGEVDPDNPHALRERVRRNATAGADVIKVMVSGGQLTPGGAAMGESQFTTNQLRIIVDEARQAGLPVAAHAHGTQAIASAVDANVDTIEHCTWMTPNGRFAPDEDIARRIATHGIAVCAASSQWRRILERLGEDRAAPLLGRLRWMADLGIRLITGTDAGLPGSEFTDIVNALELYEYLGFTHDQTIELATVNSARALGLGTRTGQLTPGYDADLLVVDGDPRHDLHALRRIRLVLTQGRLHIPTGATYRKHHMPE